MTETQAKSGTAGASTNPVDEEKAAEGGAPKTERPAVGRAAVPAEKPSPKFTRAPGMPPPPEQPRGAQGAGRPAADGATRPSSAPPASAPPAPVVGGAAGAQAPRPTSGPGVGRPTAQQGTTVTGRPPADAGRPWRNAVVGAARVTEAVRAARTTVNAAASRGPRRARLNVKRIDPWSVMKFAFAVSLVLFIVVIVATAVLYLALDAMGVVKSVNDNLADLISAGGGSGGEGFTITARGVLGTSMVVGLINVVLFTALATLGAFVYNVCADLVGGIEVTLAERD
jgi:Transmembrane domain of unknown function (DUF3566)